MPLTDDQSIAQVLRSVNTIALLGASNKPVRPSYEVMQFLLAHGFDVIPVNPGLQGSEILGQPVFATLAELPRPVDMVDVFRNAEYLPGIVDEVIALGIPTLWTQLDVIDHAAAARAEAQGVRVIMDKCPAIELPRLRGLGLL